MPTDVYQDYIQSLSTPNRIHARRWARNGLVPHAVLESELANAANFVAAIRGKNPVTWAVPIADIPAGADGTRTRWRFAYHSSPFVRRLRAMVCMAACEFVKGVTDNPTVTIYATNADESTTYGSASYTFGTSASTPTDTPDRFGSTELQIHVPTDTDVYIRVDESDGGRLVSLSMQEEMLKLNSANGYLVPASVSVSTPIYDSRRKTLLELATTLWNKQAAHLWSWTVDNQSVPRLTAFGTARNLIDNTSTTVNAASPGATLDLRYCKTRSTTTVPCVLAVYGAMDTGGDTGQVKILDSSGSTIGSVLITSTTASWHTAVVDMPATLEKFDLQFRCITGGLGDSFTVGAASLFQYA